MRNVYKILVKKFEGKEPVRWDNAEMVISFSWGQFSSSVSSSQRRLVGRWTKYELETTWKESYHDLFVWRDWAESGETSANIAGLSNQKPSKYNSTALPLT